jgi:hypothetical protein
MVEYARLAGTSRSSDPTFANKARTFLVRGLRSAARRIDQS